GQARPPPRARRARAGKRPDDPSSTSPRPGSIVLRPVKAAKGAVGKAGGSPWQARPRTAFEAGMAQGRGTRGKPAVSPVKRAKRPEAASEALGDRGFEPRTSALSERRSNRLS